jgi:hypothetical protein
MQIIYEMMPGDRARVRKLRLDVGDEEYFVQDVLRNHMREMSRLMELDICPQ